MKTLHIQIWMTTGLCINCQVTGIGEITLNAVCNDARVKGAFMSDTLYIPWENILFMAQTSDTPQFTVKKNEMN